MISQLTGQLIVKEPPVLVLDVQGVGYELEAPMTTFYHLPEIGNSVTLFTHLVVREDAHVLFGFHGISQRQLFRDLIRVNGVGPKLALTILSGADVAEFIQLIAQQDSARLTKLPGIGKKTAERLIIEMRDRLKGNLEQLSQGAETANIIQKPASAYADAESALLSLGYKPQDVTRMLRANKDSELSSEELIKQALREVWKS